MLCKAWGHIAQKCPVCNTSIVSSDIFADSKFQTAEMVIDEDEEKKRENDEGSAGGSGDESGSGEGEEEDEEDEIVGSPVGRPRTILRSPFADRTIVAVDVGFSVGTGVQIKARIAWSVRSPLARCSLYPNHRYTRSHPVASLIFLTKNTEVTYLPNSTPETHDGNNNNPTTNNHHHGKRYPGQKHHVKSRTRSRQGQNTCKQDPH